jgi:LuxR family maltose regulon positive regulatory protein
MPSRASAPSVRRRPARPPTGLRRGSIRAPRPATDEVSRTALVNRLRAAGSVPVAALVAPAGYGKTTLLAQWAARDPRPFSFVELASLAEESQAARIGEKALAALASRSPFVVVVDDADLLDERAAELVAALIRRVPPGSTLALAGRMLPIPSLPRLRANGALLELGPADLAFTRREARALLHARGLEQTDGELAALLRRTEGWPAAVADDSHATLMLDDLPRAQHEFLRRTSILERLAGPLCDAVLGRRDSAMAIATLAPATPFLVPLDRAGLWFRHHQALRARLRRELDEQEPDLVSLLEQRAADWFEANGDAESAVRCALEVGDAERAARLIEDELALPLHNGGRDGELTDWLDELEGAGQLECRPRLAAFAARVHAQRGDAPTAERRLALAAGDPSGELVRAARCPDGVAATVAAAGPAVAKLGEDDPWRAYALLLQGSGLVLLGKKDEGDAVLARAASAAERVGATETCVLALTQRALLFTAGGDHNRADELLADALLAIEQHGLSTYPVCAVTFAAAARAHLLRGATGYATTMLARGRSLSTGLTDLPWLAAQARIELAWAYAALRNPTEAATVLQELDELLAATDLGVLADERDRLAAELRATPASGTRPAGLTQAELRLLPLLATHLSFREIGLRFYLSRNTVKTQAISVYRKLGASSRSEAVERAIRLGLVEPDVDAESLIPTG